MVEAVEAVEGVVVEVEVVVEAEAEAEVVVVVEVEVEVEVEVGWRWRWRRRSARGGCSQRHELADRAARASPGPGRLVAGGPCVRLDIRRASGSEARVAAPPANAELLRHAGGRPRCPGRGQAEETDDDVITSRSCDRRCDREPALGRRRTAVRIHRSRLVDALEIENRSGGGCRRGPGPAVTRRLGRAGDLVVQRLRQRVVVRGAAVAPDQVPAARRRDRDASRQAGVDGCEKHVAGVGRRRAWNRERRPGCRVRDHGSFGGQGAQSPPRPGDDHAEHEREHEKREVTAEQCDPFLRASKDGQRPHRHVPSISGRLCGATLPPRGLE